MILVRILYRDTCLVMIKHYSCPLLSSTSRTTLWAAKTFYEWYRQNQASGSLEPATDSDKLEEFLQIAVEPLDRPLFIVIDGLDECDRRSRNSLLKLFENLSQQNPRLKAILSCRPEEEILEQLSGMVRIDVPSDSGRDGVIVKNKVERQLSYWLRDVKTLVIESLSRLALGERHMDDHDNQTHRGPSDSRI